MTSPGGSRNRKRVAEVPAPLTPRECTLGGYPSILIDIPRLRQSDFDATTDDTAWRAGINLWFSCWESSPAGSLRADDPALAKAAGMGRDIKSWMRIKAIAIRGFVLCSDGRIYHRTVCEIALGIWIDKLIRRHAGQRGNRGPQSEEQRRDELRSIEQQLATAVTHLRALCPTAPALGKLPKWAQCEPQSAPQSEPHSGRNANRNQTALRPQVKLSEGNGLPSPSQETAEVIQLDTGGGRS